MDLLPASMVPASAQVLGRKKTHLRMTIVFGDLTR